MMPNCNFDAFIGLCAGFMLLRYYGQDSYRIATAVTSFQPALFSLLEILD